MRACIERIYADSEGLARRTIARIPDGVYEAESFLDNDGVRLDRPVPIRVQVTVAGNAVHLAATLMGTAPRMGPASQYNVAGTVLA